MTAGIAHAAARTHSYRLPPARLALTPAGTGHGPLDGAWWPRCRELALELPALTDVLGPRWGPVTHVMVDRACWSHAPRTVLVPGHVVRVGRSGAKEKAHKLTLACGTVGRRDLVVIPPHTAPDTAGRLMADAADPRNFLTAATMLALADADAVGVGEATAESESGHRVAESLPEDRPAAPTNGRGVTAVFITVAVISAVVALGAVVIHRINGYLARLRVSGWTPRARDWCRSR
jgi:hypothetical protein